jgi:uncharacterized protein (DUF305 family)/DNA-binding beta-propeller fold protein YncE
MSRMSIRRKFGKFAGGVAAAIAGAAGLSPLPASAQSAVPSPPTALYWVYVGAESADLIHRIRFGPEGTEVERTIPVGELAVENEGPHGLIISPDGRYLYMTTGHGAPDGKLWKYRLGAEPGVSDSLVAPGVGLGVFPASVDITPDGLYTFSSNFNLHGDMVPSTISVVYTPTMVEQTRIVTCTMPHGSRIAPSGHFHYSTCMMDDQLVEIDTRTFAVSRRFSLAAGAEGPLPLDAGGAHGGGHGGHGAAVDPHAGHGVAADPHAGHGAAATAAPGAPPPPLAPPVDPAEVGYAGVPPHAMEPASCSPTWAHPSPDERFIYVACNRSDLILEIDRVAWAVTRRFPTGRGPYNLDVTRDGTRLVATLKQGGMVEIFDLASGASLGRLQNSTTVAHGIALTPDSRYAFITSEGVGAEPGRVDVYDLRAVARVGSVPVGQQSGGIAFWKMEPTAGAAGASVGVEGGAEELAVTTQAPPPASAPMIQPGAPGADGRVLTPEMAARLERPRHTAADVRFMQDMILHHSQALELSSLVPDRSESRGIQLLARRIERSQGDEIALMERWLRDRGEEPPSLEHAHHGGHHAHMPGMLSPEQLTQLAGSRAAEFDRLFLEFMIYHHEGAIAMVEQLFASPGAAQDGETFQFASHVDSDQKLEIARMLRMLAELD